MPNSASTSRPGPSGAAHHPSTSTTHSPAADVFQSPRLELANFRMTNKKKLPLLMCSEDDIYDPQLLETIQFCHQDTEDGFGVPPYITINAKYESYHRKTVRWMVDIEHRNSINDQSQSTGGILADLLNEDKRLEMITCIVANPSPTIIYRQKVLIDSRSKECKLNKPIPPHSQCIISKINIQFQNGPKLFNTLIKDRSQSIVQCVAHKLHAKRNSEEILVCYCNNVTSNSFLLVCQMCGEAQHENCIVYDPKLEGRLPYLCSSCWTFNDTIQCRATLIIVPEYCLELWNHDIQRISSQALKCFIYEGIQSCHFIQPTIFNKFDVVLITYNRLVKELNYGQHYVDENQATTGLRSFKRYPQSPLLCINWWRICLDQPQSYNTNIDRVFKIVSSLKSGHRWVMPGTLVQESSKNFFSIVKYLDLLKVNSDYINFTKAIKEKTEDSIFWFSNFVWYNSIKNINDELNLPKPIFEIHWLSFPTIEEYFYQKAKKFYTIKISDIKNKKKSALMNKLMDIDRNTKLDVVGDILALLEACVVPLIHGKCTLKINGTFSLAHSLDSRIIKCRAECNELLNQCVKNLKNLAEVYRFVPDGDGYAFDQYIILLMNIINDYHQKQSLTIGTDYEIIELVYKFMSLLKENTSLETKNPVCTISYLENTIQNLESNILNFHSNNILHDQQMLQQKLAETNSITKEINSLRFNDWWINILQWISSPSDFLNEVKTVIDYNRKACIPNIVNQYRMKSMSDINDILTYWLTNTIITRNDLLSMYKTLDENSNENNIEFGCTEAICTIRNECLFCQFGHKLCYYKKLLINNNIENLDENIMKNLTESNRELTISQYEILLRSLILCETNNNVTDDYIQIATERMEILSVLSSEFFNLWKLWLSLDIYKKARKQLIIAKSTITIDEVLANIKKPRRSTKIKKTHDNVVINNLLHQHLLISRSKILDYFDKFKTKHESLVYFKALTHITLKSPMFYSCKGCNADDNEHVILYCGHTLCSNCLIEACGNSNSIDLNCPNCGSSTSMENMECVKLFQEFGVQLNGSYCIKLESIVSKLKEVIALDECSKVIIFSFFEKSLECLSSALSLNSIHFMRLNIGCLNSTTVLNTFQNSENMTTLLMNYNIGLNNLRLNFATRVFFMEPIMDKSFENQIVDKICSKQIKQTYVHHFIIEDSIEEKISNTFTNDDPSLGIDLTLGQLSELLIDETDLQTNKILTDKNN